jgi:hypothetical protein
MSQPSWRARAGAMARRVAARLAGAGADRRGQVAIVFAMSTLALLTAIGSGVDLGRAYLAREQLSATAALTCQYANRPSVAQVAFGGGGATAYNADVNAFLTNAWNSQNPSVTETVATPFSYTVGGAGVVSVAASVPTTLMKVVGVRRIPVSVSTQCFQSIGATPSPPGTGPTYLIKEGFDNNHAPGTYDWYLPSGAIDSPPSGDAISAQSTFPSSPGYIGTTGTKWYIMGYCLEVDSVNNVAPSVPQGSYSAELDCDNGRDSSGNSSISTQVYLQAQTYELRYFYKARIRDQYYTPAYICGSSATDVSWATDGNYDSLSGHTATNQINVYLDPATSSGTAPTHATTAYTGSPSLTLAGADLIDTCVYAADWVERSISIQVTTAGYYWLTFAADGYNDSYGGLIDDIRLCLNSCTDTSADNSTDNFANNFPWTDPLIATATSNWQNSCTAGSASVSVLLFRDTLQNASYTNSGITANDLASSGTIETASCWTTANAGWSLAPTNKIGFAVERSGYTPPSPLTMSVQINDAGAQLMSRPFLLVPGYYKLSYDYESDAQFSLLNTIIGTSGVPSTFCGATPSAASYAWLSGGASSFSATSVVSSTSPGTLPWNVDPIAAFISSARLVSTPNLSSTLGATATYINPGSTTSSSSQTVPPDAINLASYTASTTSALLDLCLYAPSWQQRTAYIQIVKPDYYWLTFSTLASTLGASTSSLAGSVADVRLTAIGGPSTSTASFSSTPVVVPAPSPSASSTISYNTTDSSGQAVTAFTIPGETYR